MNNDRRVPTRGREVGTMCQLPAASRVELASCLLTNGQQSARRSPYKEDTLARKPARKVVRDNFILWVVEMYLEDGDGWQPTIGVKFSREEARAVLNDWRKRNPDDKFRLVTYGKKT